MKTAFTVIRVSAEDQLRGYGPDVQWFEDVLPTAPLLGLEVSEELRIVIQEPATSWDRDNFQQAVHEALLMYKKGIIKALLFPRVDRETRFLFGSFPLLAEVIRSGIEVYFARERFRLDADDPESVERYLTKATQAQAYVETMKLNTMRGKKLRAIQDHKMPSGGRKWAYEYDPATGRYKKNEYRASWIKKCYEWMLEQGTSLRQCSLRLEKEGVPSPGWEYWTSSLRKNREWKKKKPPNAGRWHATTLRNILTDPANIGQFYAYCHKRMKAANGRKKVMPMDPSQWMLVYEDPGQSAVTKGQYEALKARLRLNKENSSRHTKHSYPPLRGMIFCTLCPRRMVGFTNDDSGIAYYVCPICHNHINALNLWKELQEEIKARLLEPDTLLSGIRVQLDNGQAITRLETEEKNLSNNLESWERARDRARRLYFISPDYAEERFLAEDKNMLERQKSMKEDLAQVRGQIAELRKAMMDEESIQRFCEDVAQNLKTMDDSRWRLLLERMKLRVEVIPGESLKATISLPSMKEKNGDIVYQSSAL